MKIDSPAFTGNGTLPRKYSCDGEGVSPPLRIADVPSEAKSLVLIVDDPDAPNGTFTHWTVWNIDPSTTTIEEGAVPVGAVQGTSGSGKNAYIGACPPSGTHRYFFRLSALSAALELTKSTNVDGLRAAMAGKAIAEAELMARYRRSR